MSKSKRWNIHLDRFKANEIDEHFKRASDLYAFHALPIVNSDLGQSATEKEKRRAIESRLATMSREEWAEWEQNFEKLRAGDLSMLERGTGDGSNDNKDDRALSAPTAVQQHHNNYGTAYYKNGRRTDAESRAIDAKGGPRTGAIVNFEQVKIKGEEARTPTPVENIGNTTHRSSYDVAARISANPLVTQEDQSVSCSNPAGHFAM